MGNQVATNPPKLDELYMGGTVPSSPPVTPAGTTVQNPMTTLPPPGVVTGLVNPAATQPPPTMIQPSPTTTKPQYTMPGIATGLIKSPVPPPPPVPTVPPVTTLPVQPAQPTQPVEAPEIPKPRDPNIVPPAQPPVNPAVTNPNRAKARGVSRDRLNKGFVTNTGMGPSRGSLPF